MEIGRFAALGAIVLSTLSMLFNFLVVPVILNKLMEIRNRVEIGMTEFKNLTDRSWNEMMYIRGGVAVRSTRQVNGVPFPFGFAPANAGRAPPVGDSPRLPTQFPTQAVFNNEFHTQVVPHLPTMLPNHCPAGIAGAPGISGPDGVPGQKGLDGEPGRDGEAPDPEDESCVICPPGPPGTTGPEGPQGPPGLKGSPGINGTFGVDGWMGPPGLTGPKGQSGESGKVGQAGNPGKPAPGGKGEPGPKGAVGPIGRAGDQGLPGLESDEVGLTGAEGSQGEIGKDGKPGENGTIGALGEIGMKGGDAKYCPCPRQAIQAQATPPTTVAGIGGAQAPSFGAPTFGAFGGPPELWGRPPGRK